MARPIAIRASCWRWARVRWSVRARSPGSPSTHGVGSSGLHLPRAAAGAMTASKVARPSGSSRPVILLIAVGALRADGDPAAPGPVGVGEVAVGVQQGQQAGGGRAQPVGQLFTRDAGQGGVGVVAGGEVDRVGQVVEELADDPDVFGPDQAFGLGGGGVGEFRRQRFPGQGAAGAEVSGVLEPAVGVVAGDPQAFGDGGGDRGGTQLDGGGFGVQAGQESDARRGDPHSAVSSGAERGQQVGVGEGVDG